MDEDGEGSKQEDRKIEYLCYILCHCCLQLCQISILALMPLVCLGWLLCCLLSSTVSASVTPPPPIWQRLHLSISCCAAASDSCSSSSLVRSPLVRPSCLLCYLLSHHRLLSACAPACHCAATSHCAPLMPFVQLVVALPLIMPIPSVCRHLRLSSPRCPLSCLLSTLHSGWLSCSLSS
jgi:hypothetical protein